MNRLQAGPSHNHLPPVSSGASFRQPGRITLTGWLQNSLDRREICPTPRYSAHSFSRFGAVHHSLPKTKVVGKIPPRTKRAVGRQSQMPSAMGKMGILFGRLSSKGNPSQKKKKRKKGRQWATGQSKRTTCKEGPLAVRSWPISDFPFAQRQEATLARRAASEGLWEDGDI